MDVMGALREWLEGLARVLAPPKPAVAPVRRDEPVAIRRRPPRPSSGLYRPFRVSHAKGPER